MTNKRRPNAIELAERISEIMCKTESDARAIAAAADELYRLHTEHTNLGELEALRAGCAPTTQKEIPSVKFEHSFRHALPSEEFVLDLEKRGKTIQHYTGFNTDGRTMLEAARWLRQLANPVGPRHPTVVKWRNNAIKTCAGIADAHGCKDAAMDMRVMLTQEVEPQRNSKGITGEQWIEQAMNDVEERGPAPRQEPQEPSPTAGMSIAQRILHVGGRNPTGSTYVEFGSIQAVEALIKHAIRDAHPSSVARADALDTARLDWLEADEERRVFHFGKSWYTRSGYGMPYHKRTSLRTAIDTARTEQEPKQ